LTSALALTALTAAAPGAAGTPTTGERDTIVKTTAAAQDASPIHLGTVCNCSGPAGSSEGPPVDALRAWVEWTNAKGGINGHHVDLTVVDDRSDPSRARAAVQDMVENKGVVAIVSPFATLTHSGFGPYVRTKRIPVIGGEQSSQNYVSNPMYFSTGTANEGWSWGELRVMAQQYKERNLGLLSCVEAEACRAINSTWQKYAGSLGFKIVYTGQASIAAPDFTAQCLAAKAAGVDALVIALDLNSMRRIAPQCSRQGFHPKYGSMQEDISYLKIPEYAGLPYSNHVFPFPYDGPQAAEFHQAMAKYLPNAVLSPFYANAWVAATFLKKAISGVKGPVTAAAILDQLWTFKNETAGGLTIPMTYTRDKPTVPALCVFLTVVGKGKIEAPLGLKPLCK